MKKKSAKRPPMTQAEKDARLKLREDKKGTVSPMALYALGNRGPAPTRFTEEYLTELALKIDEWSKRDDAMYIEHFGLEHNIGKDMLPKLTEKSDVFAQSYANARARTLVRLKTMAFLRQGDGNFLAKILPMMDPEYREWCMTLAKVEGREGQAQAINIHINPEKGLEQKTIEVKPGLQSQK